MGCFMLVAFLACLSIWVHRGLAVATKLFFSLVYAGTWCFVGIDQYATVGMQCWYILFVFGLFALHKMFAGTRVGGRPNPPVE